MSTMLAMPTRRVTWLVGLGWLISLGTTLPLARAEEPDHAAAIGSSTDLASYDELVDDADREHWAFQPVVPPIVPNVKQNDWVRNPIDAFVLARLEDKGWQPAAPAAPQAILRRVYLDLIGLPPSIDEQDAFLTAPTAEALDRVVDDLLGRPSHGERWARHWLDLVRYAESNGYERDATKPHAWRYRDYVIRAFNDDKPFDRFILEQLAGDELPDADAESLIATGYYRLGPWDDEPADPKQDRFDQLDDMVNTTSQVFLGLTLGCARCHNHKFEPLTSLDYYRLVSVFNTLERPQAGRTELDLPIGTPAELEALAERDRRVDELRQVVARRRETARTEFIKTGQSKLRAEALAALSLPPDKRNEEQKKLADTSAADLDKEVEAALSDEKRSEFSARQQAIERLRQERPDLPRGYFMHESSRNPPLAHLLHRGSAADPGPEVPPGVPTVLARTQPEFPEPGSRSSLRRLTLARWIASPDNALTARVIVNRVWQYHFGEGIVRTPSDFGWMGAEPTHPELLDWLAARFVADSWSIKKLHRLITTSNTYRMSKAWNETYGTEDPENLMLWRVPYRRLEVEAIRDSMLATSGRLNHQMYGPSMYPEVPAEALAAHSDPDKIWQPFDEPATSRRTIYAFLKRSLVVPMLEVLDLCDTTRSTAQRINTSVAPQALTLFNGEFVNRQANHFADRLLREVGDDPAQYIDRAYHLALCRSPSDAERAALSSFLETETQRATATTGIDATRRTALGQVCRVIFNLNEFVYTD